MVRLAWLNLRLRKAALKLYWFQVADEGRAIVINADGSDGAVVEIDDVQVSLLTMLFYSCVIK